MAKLKEFNKQIEMEKTSGALSDISIERLIDLGLTALDREIRNLTVASAKGKLDAPSARDLRDHLKLLFEIRDRERDGLGKLSDEELQAQVEELKK